MHIPELSTYPLVLRNFEVSNPRVGELMLDYETDDLYYIKASTGKRIRVADDIYNQIMLAKIQNNAIEVIDEEAGEEIDIADRIYNAFYYMIYQRGNKVGTKITRLLDLDNTESYIVNDIGEEDPNGNVLVIAPDEIISFDGKILVLDVDEPK